MGRIATPDAVTLRARVSGWARYVFTKNRYPSVAAMAKDMNYNQGSLNGIINGKGTIGLDFAIKLALVGQESLDTILLRDPAPTYMQPGRPRATTTRGFATAEGLVHETTAPYQKKGAGRAPKELS